MLDPMPKVQNNGRSVTAPQSLFISFGANVFGRALLDKRMPSTYTTYRQMRRQPTIALGRALTIAPAVAGEWQVQPEEGAPPDAEAFIIDELLPIREQLITATLEHGIDYGWSPWETVIGVKPWRGQLRNRIIEMKPLLHDITDILLENDTGHFAGFRQLPTGARAGDTPVPADIAWLVSFRVEGANLYGEPLLENIRHTYLNWLDCNDGAERYDRKVAGTHWVITYPPGRTKVNGVETDNQTIAQDLIAAMESSGSAVMPAEVNGYVEDLNNNTGGGWSVELKESAPQQAAFNERLAYLDKCFIRGLLTPERSVLEAEYGTKADAGVHSDWAMTQRELEHRFVTRRANEIVDRLLYLNWGPEAVGKVKLVASPLVNAKLTFFRDVYRLLLANPGVSLDLTEAMDLASLTDAIGIPVVIDAAQRTGIVGPGGPTEAQAKILEGLTKLYKSATGEAPEPVSVKPPEATDDPAAVPAPTPADPGVDPGVDKAADTALNGAQIASAMEIVLTVARRELPRDSGLAMLESFFNLSPEECERIMGTSGTGTGPAPAPKPEPVPAAV